MAALVSRRSDAQRESRDRECADPSLVLPGQSDPGSRAGGHAASVVPGHGAEGASAGPQSATTCSPCSGWGLDRRCRDRLGADRAGSPAPALGIDGRRVDPPVLRRGGGRFRGLGLGPGPLRTARAGLCRVGLGALLVIGVWSLRPGACRWERPSWASAVVIALIGVVLAALFALRAMLPTPDFDALEYHLQGPKEYYQAGRIAFLPHNVYTSMPFNVEMLHLLGMEVLDDWWRGALVGQLLVSLFAPATAAMMALDGRALGLAAGGVGRRRSSTCRPPGSTGSASIPYVEGPLCYYHAAL